MRENKLTCGQVNISGQGPVVRSLVSANRWLRGIKTYRFPWYLTLVSTNHASSNPAQIYKQVFTFFLISSSFAPTEAKALKAL